MQTTHQSSELLQFAKKYRDAPQKFWNNVWTDESGLSSTKVMERPICGERRDLLMIQDIQSHL